MSDEEKLAEYNKPMKEEAEKTGKENPAPTKITADPSLDNSPEALITKTGRLGVGRRLKFMGEQMITGVKALWNEYKGWIIGSLIAALVVIGAILFFSAGTTLGAVIAAIGEVLVLIFGAYAVGRAMDSLWDYVTKAWAGDTKGAAKSLAKAFAIIIVEFLVDKIMLGMGKVFKNMLKAMKGSRVGRFVRNTIAFVKKAKRSTSALIKKGIASIRGSRLVLYMEKITAKGIGKLDDLRNKILTKFGFKKIWLEKQGKFVELWGEFNAKVLLMREDGTPDVDALGKQKFRELTAAERKAFGNEKYIGKTTADGIVVSDNFKVRFEAGEVTKTYDELLKMPKELRRAEVMSSSISRRLEYMGATPSKTSKQGKEVIERMRLEGKIEERFEGTFFQTPNKKWHPINEADMSHIDDAVTWWNNTGREFGAKTEEIRDFMLNSKNYELDHFSINRSKGSKLGQTENGKYLPPL
jgi:hypothetical protein